MRHLEAQSTVYHRRRVAITGLGVVAPNGIGKDAFWQALVSGKSAIDWITSFDASPFPCKVAGEVRNFRPQHFMTIREARDLWRFSQFAVASSRMAIEDARLRIEPNTSHRVAACFATCVNGFDQVESNHQAFLRGGYQQIDPLTCLQYSTHAPVSHVSIGLGIKGPTMTLSSGCSSGLDVVKWGADQIRDGGVDVALVGGTEAPLTPLLFATFSALDGLARTFPTPAAASRPYDRTRDGIVLAEGAAALVLENLDHALDRGAPLYAEVVGYGLTSEALHLRRVDLCGDAIARAITNALASARVSVHDVDYINAHGNSLPDYDLAESSGIKRALGAAAYSVPVSSIKSMIGQPIAASGALQTVAAALTLREGVIPPTINYNTPDPACDLDYVPNRARVARVKTLLVNAHAAGGSHSVLALRRFSD